LAQKSSDKGGHEGQGKTNLIGERTAVDARVLVNEVQGIHISAPWGGAEKNVGVVASYEEERDS